jgi:hypothetical protein
VSATASTNVLVLVNGYDLSNHVTEVSTSETYEEIDTTCVNDRHRSRTKGIMERAVRVRFLQDFTAAKVHSLLQPLLSSNYPFPVEIRPVNAAVSATNPALMMEALLFNYSVVDGQVGEVLPVSALFVGTDVTGGGVGYLGYPDSPFAYPDLLMPL